MELRTLQQNFQAALLDLSPGFAAQIVGTPEASAAQRIDIYAQAYRLRLLEVLDGDYPKLGLLLGDDRFDALGRAYIDTHPSRYPSLRWFSGQMSEFLRETEPYASQPVLAEMAAFEWSQNAVFDAADTAAVPLDAMAAIPPDAWANLRLRPHPAVRRLDLVWNVPEIWRALDDETEPPAPEAKPHPQCWLLWRRDLSIHWRSLEVDEAWAIDAWRNGASFGEICEGLCEWIDAQNVALHAAGFLKGWISEGLVAELLLD